MQSDCNSFVVLFNTVALAKQHSVLGHTTSVISPIGVSLRKRSYTFTARPLIIDSLSLVNSMHTANLKPWPAIVIRLFIVVLTRLGDSNATIVKPMLNHFINCVFVLWFDFGRKPANANLFVGILAHTSAQIAALAPGATLMV